VYVSPAVSGLSQVQKIQKGPKQKIYFIIKQKEILYDSIVENKLTFNFETKLVSAVCWFNYNFQTLNIFIIPSLISCLLIQCFEFFIPRFEIQKEKIEH